MYTKGYMGNMRTYQFESVIPDNGRISLPMTMKNLTHHRVKCILIDLGDQPQNPLDRLDALTRQYTELNEADINIEELYTQRTHINDRQHLFD